MSNETETLKSPETPKVPAKAKPIVFTPPESIEVNVYGYYRADDGTLAFVSPNPPIEDSPAAYTVLLHQFMFSHTPYNELNSYRTQSLIHNAIDKTSTINQLKLRDFLWVWHLKDWNYTNEDNAPIPLTFDPNGALSDNSLNQLYTIPANVLDLAISLYERKINIG